MQIERFKRWHWAVIGLVLGLVVSWWSGWVGSEGTLLSRSTIDVTEFEQLLAAKAPPDRPLIRNIAYYGREDGTDWLIAERLIRKGRRKDAPTAYLPVKVAVERPYVPKLDPPAKTDPNFTVVDYLKSVSTKNPQVRFSTRWWGQEPMRSPLYALVGMAVMAGAFPLVLSFLGGRTGDVTAAATEKRSADFDLSRFGKGGTSAATVKRGPSEADLAHLRELEAELEQRLAPKHRAAPATPAAPAPGAASPQSPPPPPIRKLDGGPIETPQAEGKPPPPKQYGGEFYPTETHVKRDKES